MTDKDYVRRLERIAVVCMLLMLGIVIGFSFWASYQIRDLKLQVAVRPAKGDQGAQGVQGLPGTAGLSGLSLVGSPGLKGDKGDPGSAGMDSTTPGPQGDKGDTGSQGQQGETGAPGKTVYQRTNPLTGQEECRYAGDDTWQPAEECQ